MGKSLRKCLLVCLLFEFIKAMTNIFDLAFWAEGRKNDAWGECVHARYRILTRTRDVPRVFRVLHSGK